ncbi:MAG TPA: lipopolysaccharide assembly protein LapA domain-containing protein [Anaerolineales bacterium]|nr:lipopolysaccharide assembly protein LapA domain-containing protein [Anaerolineales bacterium]
MILSLIFVIVVSVVAVFFALQNNQLVNVSFFGYPISGAIGIFLLLALALGILLGVILMLPSIIKNSWSLSRQKKQIAELAQKPARKSGKNASSKK